MFFKRDDKLIKEAKELNNLGEQILNVRQEVLTNRHLLSLMFENVPALIFFKDVDNNVVNINKYGANLWGATKEEILGKGWMNLTDKETAQKYFDNDLDVIKSGEPKLNIIESLVGDKGKTRKFKTDKIPIMEDGKIIGVLGHSVEITEPLRDCRDGG